MALPLAAMAETAPAPGVSTGSYIQALLALGVIVALLAGTAWLARKVTGGKGFGQGGVKVVGGVALGPRERIVLVEAGNTWLVIGIVPGQIRTLHTMPKGEALPADLAAAVDKPFAQWLKQMMEKRGGG
ncbi:MAG: Flagellar biosynthesis protein, FliO [Rhodocyclaceae bacterium]|nr:Flagellar biosynthesis protein, FliO [Rhodocyclaceae bacterium]